MPAAKHPTKPRSHEAVSKGEDVAFQHALAAFVADRSQDFDPLRLLPRGTVVALPLLDSIEDLPIDLDAHCHGARTALIFYQGGWDAACCRMLRSFAEAEPLFAAESTILVGISPELPKFARQTAAANGVGFALAVDQACRFARSLGLAYKLPLQLRRIVRDNGLRIKNWNGEGSYNLPMPVVLLLDRSRRVRWIDTAHAPDALDPERLLKAIHHMTAAEKPTLQREPGRQAQFSRGSHAGAMQLKGNSH